MWKILLYFFAVILFFLLVIVMYAGLADFPFGAQIATAITYTAVMFWYLFLPNRMGPPYSVREAIAGGYMPRLLALHGTCLGFILVFLTILFKIKTKLPASWLRESGPKHDSVYKWLVLTPPTIVGFVQLLISRMMLKRRPVIALD